MKGLKIMQKTQRDIMHLGWIVESGFHSAYATKNLLNLIEKARKFEMNRCLDEIERYSRANMENDNTVAMFEALRRSIIFEY